jgi:hypothetical protein
VHFDVALTETKGKGAAGGVGVFLGAVNLGTKGSAERQEVAVSRVKFTIPITLPDGPETGTKLGKITYG